MHVLINATGAAMGAGITVPRMLLPALAGVDQGEHRYTVVCRKEIRDKLDPHLPRVNFLTVDATRNSLPARLFTEQFALPVRAAVAKADVLFSPFNVAVWLAPTPQVLMFQNVAPYTPEVVRSYEGAIGRRLRMLRKIGVISARRARQVVFVSSAQRDAILPWLSIKADKTSVVYTGWDTAFTPEAKTRAKPMLERLGVNSRYLLSVSQFYRYKNIVELIEGFARAIPRLPSDVQLVLAGAEPEPEYSAEIRRAIRQANLEPRVKILGQVPYAELPPLYAAATLFLFPSICESFPNILLEALAAGVPVLSSDACSMPEIAGAAAVYFNARSSTQIAERIEAVWNSPEEQARLGAAGVAQAQKYSWSRTANDLLRVLTAASRSRP